MDMVRPWKLLRFILRILLYTVLSWLLLVVLWIALPFPSHEAAGDAGYATSVLTFGKPLTRVYFPAEKFSVQLAERRHGFAVDYSLNTAKRTLSISGLSKPLPVEFPADAERHSNPYEYINVTVRAGDDDGANLPWFPKADAVLLFWRVHRETVTVPMVATWSLDGDVEKLSVKAMRGAGNALLEVSVKNKDNRSFKVDVPPKPADNDSYQPSSSSPSMTYSMRVLLISIIAPTALFLNAHFGGLIGAVRTIFYVLVSSAGIFFAALMYAFILGAVVVSVWRCCKIRSRRVDDCVQRVEQNPRWSGVLRVCREGWHPERDRAAREEVEGVRGLEGGDGGGAKRVLDRIIWEARSKETVGAGRSGRGS